MWAFAEPDIDADQAFEVELVIAAAPLVIPA